ncbi:MAG: hypothetical protein KA259_04875 [Caldilineaceae bacterium]|nr:hypothetical protein [Caldilineaceae bacterium]
MASFSRTSYEQYLYSLPEHNPAIRSSSLRLFTIGRNVGMLRGSLWFTTEIELRIQELLDLSDGEILEYSYTVFFQGERIRWYDPQPHPENEDLRSTFPHHRHEPPDIKHNRRPAPGISFRVPNLPILIDDCIALGATMIPGEADN